MLIDSRDILRIVRSFNHQQIYSQMQQNFSFRSKSASEKQESSFPHSLKLNLKSLAKHQLQDPIDTLERDIERYQKPPTILIPSAFSSQSSKAEVNPAHQMARNSTAIHELERLITPRVNNLLQEFQKVNKGLQTRRDEILQKKEVEPEEKQSHKTTYPFPAQSNQYYQRELAKVGSLLAGEQRKNSHLQQHVIKLERKLSGLQQQKYKASKSIVMLRQENKDLKHKYSQLQKLSKQQMIVNLELEALFGKFTIKHSEKVKEQTSTIDSLKQTLNGREDKFKDKLKALEQEYLETKNVGEEQISSLLMELKTKSTEINRLKNNIKVLHMQNEYNLQKAVTSTIPSTHYMQSSNQQVQTRFSRTGHKISEDLTNHIPTFGDSRPEQLFKLTSKVFDNGSAKIRSYSKTDRV